MPAVSPQQCGNPPVSVTTILFSERNDRFRERFFILATTRFLALGRAVLAERLASPALGNAKLFDDAVNTVPPTRRA